MEFEKRRERIRAGFNSAAQTQIISVRIESPESMFDSFDPSPPGSKRLNEQLESRLVDAINEMKARVPVKIRIIVSEGSGITESVSDNITRHFNRKAETAFAAAKRKFRLWRFNMVIGILFLAACLALSHFFSLPLFEGSRIFTTLRESIVIIGWVALWEPTTFILYGWREDARDVNAYIRLSLAKTEFAVK